MSEIKQCEINHQRATKNQTLIFHDETATIGWGWWECPFCRMPFYEPVELNLKEE